MFNECIFFLNKTMKLFICLNLYKINYLQLVFLIRNIPKSIIRHKHLIILEV